MLLYLIYQVTGKSLLNITLRIKVPLILRNIECV